MRSLWCEASLSEVGTGQKGGGGGAPGGAVEVAVADGFAHVEGKYVGRRIKVGNCAGNLEYAVIGTCTHVIAGHSGAEYLKALFGELSVTAHQT